MDVSDRARFYDELYCKVTEGYDTPLNLRSAATRFKKAVDVMGMLSYNSMTYWFNGRSYVPLFYRELRSGVSECFDRAEVYARIKLIDDVVRLCKLRMDARSIDAMPWQYISAKNGIIDLDAPTPRLIPHTKEIFITRYFDYDYDKDAGCPLWKAFLDEVLPDRTLQMVLQEFLGAIFIDRSKSKVEVMMWLYGDGANGKSVVFNTLVGVLGKENVTTRDMRDFCHATRGSFALSDIEGKLLNYCSDVQGQYTFTDMAKRIISGEPVHAERKFENARMVTDIPLMMANCNTLPKLGDKTNAWSRRVKIIPFNYTVPPEKQDKNLSTKLLAERSGILNWIFEGRRRYIRQGLQFSVAPQCDLLMHNYRAEGFDVLDFMQAEGLTSIRYHIGDEGAVILSRELYRVFKSWLEVNRAPEYALITLPQFRKKLLRYGYVAFHTRDGAAIRAYSIESKKAKSVKRRAVEEHEELHIETQEEERNAAARNDVLERIAMDINES